MTTTESATAVLTAYESVSTDKLALGDILHNHGMRILLDTEPQSYEDRGCTVYAWPGLVLNAQDLAPGGSLEDRFIWRHLHDDVWEDGIGWVRVFTGRWTIQGNHLATWCAGGALVSATVTDPTNTMPDLDGSIHTVIAGAIEVARLEVGDIVTNMGRVEAITRTAHS